MTTSSVSSTSSTAAGGYSYDLPATYSAASTSTSTPIDANTIETALGMTSSIDTATLAQNLVNAVSEPQTQQINSQIATQNAKIAGYTAINSALTQLSSAFTTLDTNTNLQNYSASVSNTSVANVTSATTVAPGIHTLTVTQLAQAQSSTLSTTATSASGTDSSLPASFTLNIGSWSSATPPTLTATQTVTLTNADQTPQGMINAINNANLGITASFVDTGTGSNPYQIVLSGTSGAANAFDVTDASGDTLTTQSETAQDAQFSLDGLSFDRSSNTVSDALTGATLQLQGSGTTSINLTQDTSAITTDLNSLVTAYNSLQTVLKNASTPGNTTTGYGGSLAQDPAIQMIQQQVLAAMQADPSYTDSGTTTTLPTLADMGITVQQDGTMALDSTTLASELSSNYSGVVQALNMNTAGVDGLLPNKGIAGGALNSISSITNTTGILASNESSAQGVITQEQTDLTNLNTRMSSMLSNYTQQFAQMSAILAQASSTKSELTAEFNSSSSSSG
jgi:flagellar hook-associated protein 2